MQRRVAGIGTTGALDAVHRFGREAGTHQGLGERGIQRRPVDAVARVEHREEIFHRQRVEAAGMPGQREGLDDRRRAERVVRQRQLLLVQHHPHRHSKRLEGRVVGCVEALRHAVDQQVALDLVHIQQGHAQRPAGLAVFVGRPQHAQRAGHHGFEFILDGLAQRGVEKAVEGGGLLVQHHGRRAQVLRLCAAGPPIHEFEQIGAQILEVGVLALCEEGLRARDQRLDMPQRQRACGRVGQRGRAAGIHAGAMALGGGFLQQTSSTLRVVTDPAGLSARTGRPNCALVGLKAPGCRRRRPYFALSAGAGARQGLG